MSDPIQLETRPWFNPVQYWPAELVADHEAWTRITEDAWRAALKEMTDLDELLTEGE